jgi:hypothetical protein
MNPATAKPEIRSALASAAKHLEREPAFKELIPYKVEIQDLRSKGASFVLIAELLKKHSLNISREKVRRFYYAEIHNSPIPRKKRKRRPRRAKPSFRAPITEKKPSAPTSGERGPRIARIEEL